MDVNVNSTGLIEETRGVLINHVCKFFGKTLSISSCEQGTRIRPINMSMRSGLYSVIMRIPGGKLTRLVESSIHNELLST